MSEAKYSIGGIQAGQKRARENISDLKVALRSEKRTITDYEHKIERGHYRPKVREFSLEGLEHGIERAQHNIDVLKGAMKRERDNIAHMNEMIDAQRKAEELANPIVHIEYEVDDGDPN